MKIVRAIAIVSLVFLGITSVIGAIPMILQSNEEPWQMPRSLLDHSPFNSFLTPGILLLLSNGLFSFLALNAVLDKGPGAGGWVTVQGCILSGWLIAQVALFQIVVWPQLVYAGLALALIVCGLALSRHERALAARTSHTA